LVVGGVTPLGYVGLFREATTTTESVVAFGTAAGLQFEAVFQTVVPDVASQVLVVVPHPAQADPGAAQKADPRATPAQAARPIRLSFEPSRQFTNEPNVLSLTDINIMIQIDHFGQQIEIPARTHSPDIIGL
jgi:hypothetical protein